jgi:hypothetical protein
VPLMIGPRRTVVKRCVERMASHTARDRRSTYPIES